MTNRHRIFRSSSPNDGIVDFRFSLLIEEILSRKWLMSVQLTQSDLARILGVSRQTVSGWTNRTHGISIDTASKFVDCGGVEGYFSKKAMAIHNDISAARSMRFEKWLKKYMEE